MEKFLLPNTQYFSAIPTGKNLISNIFGIDKNNHDIFNIDEPSITKANEYLIRMDKRLIKAAKAKNSKRYLAIMNVLLKRSTTFQIACFNHKYPEWFWKSKSSTMKKIYHSAVMLKITGACTIEYTRSWIPKGLDPYGRPLGAPTIPWRIYLFQMLYFTDVWVEHSGMKAPWQHGGYKGRGVNTFMDDMINRKVFNYKYIWEFDLKGFFNNILHKAMLVSLKRTGLPQPIINLIEGGLISQPAKYKLPPAELIPESQYRVASYESDKEVKGAILLMDDWFSKLMRDTTLKPGESMGQIKISRNLDGKATITKETKSYEKPSEGSITTPLKKDSVGRARDSFYSLGQSDRGTPQGVSWSPYITSLTTGQCIGTSHPGIIMYMDDGLLFANTKSEIEKYKTHLITMMNYIGVSLAEAKCGFIKEDGIWAKNLKILGTSYDYQIDWIFSSTRSGTVTAMPRPNYDELNKEMKEISSEYKEHLHGLLCWLGDVKKDNNGSKKRMIEYLERKINELKLAGPKALPTHEYGPVLGMTGKFLSYIWADPKKGDVKRLIKEGQFNRIAEMEINKLSFLGDLRSSKKWQVHNAPLEANQLSTISTDMILHLFKYVNNHKKELRRAKSK